MERLKKRADFLKLAKGSAVRMPCFVLQYQARTEREARIGFTVTKRQGNSVIRNRIKRRLREAVRLVHQSSPFPPADFVVIGRKESLKLSFADLLAQMTSARNKAHAALS